MSGISNTERAELRRVVRAQFKVLHSEIDQRAAELLVELDDEIRDRFADDDKAWSDLTWQIAEVAREANRAANDAIRKSDFEIKPRDGYDHDLILAPHLRKPLGRREQIRSDGQRRIAATVRAAKVQLQRQEADLLRELAADAIESDYITHELSSIPTVGELVPSTRLAQIEAELSCRGVRRMTKNVPSLARDEIAVKVRVTVPDHVFAPRIAGAELTVNPAHVVEPVAEVEALDAPAEPEVQS